MRPYLFKIPLWHPIYVRSYGVLLAVGALVGIWLAARRAHKVGFEKQRLVDAGVLIVLWGVVGARVFYVLGNPGQFWQPAAGVVGFLKGLLKFVGGALAVWHGGLVFYGGLAAAIGYMVFRHTLGAGRTERHKLAELWDIAAPSALIGLGFTRIGCFLNGCCYGRPTEYWPSVRYPPGALIFADVMDAGTWLHQHYYDLAKRSGMVPMGSTWSFLVHPTQLYSALFGWLFGGFLYWYWPRRKGNGEVGGMFLIGYTMFRFSIEFIRVNPPVFGWAPFSIAQWLSLLGFAFGVWLLLAARGAIHSPWRWIGLLPASQAR